MPPRSSVEAGFDGLAEWPEIEGRLLEIARDKCADVLDQLSATGRLAADRDYGRHDRRGSGAKGAALSCWASRLRMKTGRKSSAAGFWTTTRANA